MTYSQWFKDADLNRWLGPVWTAEELVEMKVPSEDILVMEADGALVGVASLDTTLLHEGTLAINGLAIEPRLMGQALGSTFLSLILKKYAAQVSKAICFTEDENLLAKRFIEKLGWVEVSRDGTLIRYEKNLNDH